ncbi:MAG: primosomal protein N' [Candidatus Eremiobacteraeota bacterium]|nr:primosomal protein N' [Candidatus Eremiobacteraeota bacterium]
MSDKSFAQIVVDLNVKGLDRLFTYHVPPPFRDMLEIGSIVRIPFGNKMRAGFVVEFAATGGTLEKGIEIKDIDAVLRTASPWRRELIELAQWMCRYYGCTFLEALRASLPPSMVIRQARVRENEKFRKLVVLKAPLPAGYPEKFPAKAPRQREALDKLSARGSPLPAAELGVSLQVLRDLQKKDLVEIREERINRIPGITRSFDPTSPFQLTSQQQEAYDKAVLLMKNGEGSVMLLHGVTGSGKTEVYLQAIAHCLSQGRTALVLVSEIALTPQALDRFRGRFGAMVALLHSGLSAGERHDEWRRIMEGEARVVLGARGAVFAPLEDLGLLILDEEHETSYKSEADPRYHARHVAVKRALHNRAVLLLGSASPSLESYYRARQGAYTLAELPERIPGTSFPSMKIVDLRKYYNRPGGRLFSPYLTRKIRDVLKRGEQAILLINRRGLYNYLYCTECGHIISCPHCDIALRIHRDPMLMRCHYCLYEHGVPEACPHCKGPGLSSRGGGTQRAESELAHLFPQARIIRMDRDTTRKKGAYDYYYDLFRRGDADILLGTQMIAKGLDFPRVTLAGVLMADVALSLPDFRSGERTYQLLLQVAGRSARSVLGGEVVIQTYNPDHPALAALMGHDHRCFYEWELRSRQELSYPPFMHMVRLVFSGPQEGLAGAVAGSFKDELSRGALEGHIIMGPAPCPLSFLRNEFRFQILIKTRAVTDIVALAGGIRERFSRKEVRVTLDVDPVSFL